MVTRVRAGTRNGKPYYKAVPSSGGSSASDRRRAQQRQQSEAIERWKRGEITKEQASAIVKRVRRGGGSGAAADPEMFAAAQKAQQRAAEAALIEKTRQAEIKRLAEEKAAKAALDIKARVEFKRILDARSNLIKRGVRERTVLLTDRESRDKLKVSTWTDRKGNRVIRTINKTKGTTKYDSFARGRRTGGVSMGSTPTTKEAPSVIARDIKVVASERAGQKLVILKSGKKFRISDNKRVTIGAEIAGNRLEFQDGILRRIDGVDLFEEKLKPVKVEKSDKIISKVRAENLIKDYTRKISTIKNDLGSSANTGEIARLAELQRMKSLTIEDKKEKQVLTKSVASNYKKVSNMIALVIATAALNLGVGSVALYHSLRRDPIGTVKSLPKTVWDGIKQDITRVKSGSLEAFSVAIEYITLGAILKGVGKVTGSTVKTVSKINPKYVKSVDGKFVLRKAPVEIFKVKGKTRLLKTRVMKPSFTRPFSSVSDFLKGRKPGQFKKFTKDPGLILKEQTVKTGAKSLSEQAKLAGTEVTAVNAAAQQLTSWIKRKQLVRKPIPGEANFPVKIKNILSKFDEGVKLTTKEFAEVNLWLQKNVAPNITLLERSLYLDPAGGLRISRLGIQNVRSATLKDILRGNFRLWQKSGKPQVLIFENAKIAKFPKSLQNVKRKLSAGKKLTTAETNQLIAWQIKTGSGKFKPIGSTIYELGKELEITLAPGEFIKRIKRVGFSYINGKKVNFVTAKIFKPSKKLINQIKKANNGEISKIQVSKLENNLSKRLGRKVRIETPTTRKIPRIKRRTKSDVPVLRVRGSGIFVRGMFRLGPKRPVKVKRPIPRTTKRPTKRLSPKRPGKPVRPTQKRPVKTGRPKPKAPKRPVKRPVPRTTKRPRPTPTKKPPIIFAIPKGFRKRRLTKKVPVYFVVMKRKGKLVKLHAKPLSALDSRDYLAYRLDRSLGRSAWIEPLGKSKDVLGLPKEIKGYFAKVKHKLRPFKIRRGVKKAIRHGYIERKAFIGDTPSELRQLKTARRKAIKRTKKLKKKRIVKRRPIKRVVTKLKSQKKKIVVKRKVKRTGKRKSSTRKRVVKRKIMKRKPKRKIVRKKKKKK